MSYSLIKLKTPTALKKLFVLLVIVLFSTIASAQYVYQIKADSVKIHNDSCKAELIIENSTKNVDGFLRNKGNGRTEFSRIVVKAGDSTYSLGSKDTLQVSSSKNVILNQYTSKQVANYSIDTGKSIHHIITDTSRNSVIDINGSAGTVINWTEKYPFQGLNSSVNNYNEVGNGVQFISDADSGSNFRRSHAAFVEKGILGRVGPTQWGDNVFWPSYPAFTSRGYYYLKLPVSKTTTFTGNKDWPNAGTMSAFAIGMQPIGNDTAIIQTGYGQGAAINHLLRYDCWPNTLENVIHKGQYINSLSYLDYRSKTNSYIESFVDYYAGAMNNYTTGDRIKQKINFYAANDQYGYTDRSYGFYQDGSSKYNFFGGKVLIKDSSVINADVYDFYVGGSSKFSGNLYQGGGRVMLAQSPDDGVSSLQLRGQAVMDSLTVGSLLRFKNRSIIDLQNKNEFTTRMDPNNGFGFNFNGGYWNGGSSMQILSLAGYHYLQSLGSTNGLHLGTYPATTPVTISGSKVIMAGYGSGAKTGTATYNLAVDANGGVVEVATTTSVSAAPAALTDAATITWDVSTGTSKYVTLAGNRTLSFSNLSNLVGSYLYLKVSQDAFGSRSLLLPSICKVVNGGGGAVTLTTTANAFDVIQFYIFSSSEVHVSYGRNFN
jgi:hypothetical protein